MSTFSGDAAVEHACPNSALQAEMLHADGGGVVKPRPEYEVVSDQEDRGSWRADQEPSQELRAQQLPESCAFALR